MEVACIPLSETGQLDSLIADYLSRNSVLSPFIEAFPDKEAFLKKLSSHSFSPESRELISEVLLQQAGSSSPEKVLANIEALKYSQTFTVTTGHQLCLFTGPQYFIYKILSTIRLSRTLQEWFPTHRFVPVYWMASEDHDFAEINHVYAYGRKIEWPSTQTGAVGRFQLSDITPALTEISPLLGEDPAAERVRMMLEEAYAQGTLAAATRYIVNLLFEDHGVVVVDGDDARLKNQFSGVMKDELLWQNSYQEISRQSRELNNLGYKTQVNPREINLFYLQPGLRNRIEKTADGYTLVGENKSWTENQMKDELSTHPERFSPNVVMRPLYQESILPNLAYIGGPGELAYWFQLKGSFAYHNVSFPLLVLRDSALLIPDRTRKKMEKAGINVQDLFSSMDVIARKLVNAEEVNLDEEKNKLTQLFDTVRAKAAKADPTLEATAAAELQKQIGSLENLEKRMVKALKTREELRLSQVEKIRAELLPDGKLNERKENFLPYLSSFGPGLIETLLASFDPLKGELKVLYED